MRIAVIGRSELLYNTALLLAENGYKIALIITAAEAPEYKVTADDFKKLAADYNAIFIKTSSINKYSIIEQIKSCGEIDIAVSINYSGIIKKQVIQLFPFGILNGHGGDLPRYRGNACQAWAIINGEEKIGLCVHKMIPGELDSGNILTRDYCPININTRIQEVYDWMNGKIPVLMLQAIKELKKDKSYFLEEQSLDPSKALRCYPRILEDGFINWCVSNEQILRIINASSEPFSGAYTYLNSKKVVLWRASLYKDLENYLAVPGQISSINKNNGSIHVITGRGKLQINEIEIDGVRTAPAEIIKSIRQRFSNN